MVIRHTPRVKPGVVTRHFRKLPLFFGAVKFEHTIFALPFAYIGMLLAAGGLPTFHQFLWITLAMVGARTLAMSANRLVHHQEDAANPRTAGRHLPRGLLRPAEMLALLLLSAAVFFFAAWKLNSLALALAPAAAVYIVLYSYVKYFSWLTHFILGLADGIAPAGGWVGVTGSLDWPAVFLTLAVTMWVGGFDVLYACQDLEFDRRHRVHSIPVRFGVPAALWWSRGMHALTSLSLLAVALWMGLGWPYYLGWAIAATLLVYEHRLLKPHDLSRLNAAFFNVNGYIALVVLLATLAAVLLW
ncbi:MAG: UbiA family prenyltransferase [Chloroflexi bacterium]|nr:UbiA family prenyltransferase [Chloroflexota bacterium]